MIHSWWKHFKRQLNQISTILKDLVSSQENKNHMILNLTQDTNTCKMSSADK
jgi:hypothetical protein